MKNLPLLLVIGFVCAAPFAFSQSAEEMASNCKGIVDAKIVNDQIAVPSDFQSGVCWGAFGTIQTIVTIVPRSFPQNGPLFEVCLPHEGTRSQLIRIFMAYTERHPERLHEDYFFIATTALKQAFPCGKQ
jgi:hypothetical protein